MSRCWFIAFSIAGFPPRDYHIPCDVNTPHKALTGIGLATILVILAWLSFFPPWSPTVQRGEAREGSEAKTGAPSAHGAPGGRLAGANPRVWKIIFEILEDLERDDSALDLDDPESIREVFQPLLEAESPVMAPLLLAMMPYGGHAPPVIAICIMALEWETAVEELLLLVDSDDARLRALAQSIVSFIYQGWSPETAQDYGALDLPAVLRQQYRKHGPLSARVWGAVTSWVGMSSPPGHEQAVINKEWFDLPEIPERFQDGVDVESLEAALASDSWAVRSSAVWGAFYERKPPLMLAGLRDPDVRVALAALEALMDEEARVGELLSSQPAYPEILEDLSTREDPRVRALATWAYGQLLHRAPNLGAGPLLESLSDPAPTARQWALDGLRSAGRLPAGEEERILSMAMTSSDLGVRYSAARLLQKLGSPDAKDALDQWLHRDDLVPRYIANALAQSFVAD